MRDKMRNFFIGRYGYDNFSKFLFGLALALWLIGLFFRRNISGILSLAYYAVLIYAVYRILSKNVNARYAENMKYLKYKNIVLSKYSVYANRLKDMKSYRFVKCPNCKITQRVPKGVGKVKLKCPRCGNTIIKKC